jgi:hypothetical protein
MHDNGKISGVARKATLIFAAALMLIQISGIASAQGTPSQCQITFSSITSAYNADLPVMLVAVLAAFAIAALFFIVGIMLKSDKLRNFGIGELYEAFASALIVAFFLYIAYSMLVIIPSVLNVPDPYTLACTGITTTINQASTVFSNLFDSTTLVVQGGYLWNTYHITQQVMIDKPPQFAGGVQVIKAYDKTFNLANIGLALPLYAFVVLPVSTIASFLIDGIYILWSEYYLMQFFSVVGPVLVAAGVVFRAIFPTRGFGAALIATGIALYLVMPTLFAFAFEQTCTVACLPSGTLPAQLQQLNSYISNFWLIILFYPPLIIALTYTFITQVSGFIGQSTSIGGRIRGFI